MCEDMKANIDKLSSTPDRESHLLFLVVCSTLVLGQNKSICANSTNGSGRQEKTMSALLNTTDGRTDIPAYRDARPSLKTKSLFVNLVFNS